MVFGFLKETAMKKESLVVGLDIGTTRICAVVAEVPCVHRQEKRWLFNKIRRTDGLQDDKHNSSGSGINIIGVGKASSRGIKKGIITNIESTVDSIVEAVQAAESAAGVDIKSVHISISGVHIGCLSSHGVIGVKEKEIGSREVAHVIEAAKAVAIPFDREILHVLPSGFIVDGQNGITDPRGMAGVRLETNVKIITGAAASTQNLIRSCQKAGLDVTGVVFQPLASAAAVLTQDEKDLGVAVIDIGGGTTDMALYYDGSLCHAAVLAVGGNNFTNDVAVGLRTPAQEAERIKKKHGCVMISCIKGDEEIDVGFADGKLFRNIPRRHLVEILQPRAEELFGFLRDEIRAGGFQKIINSGVVLTGGSAAMEGMATMAENILELPVRLGRPAGFEGADDMKDDPSFAAAAGLAMYCAEESMSVPGNNGGMKARVKGWYEEAFKIFS
ncbi:MAG: cell division protein FtsA [Nitrospiraceae bacterium]|nr:MAG: cell division protein FtsA [Nitrospiraceae bacterium]